MSSDSAEESADMMCCANCGKAEIDDVKLKDCPGGCDLAKYCGNECQEDHREIHEAICKERAAELRDEILFRQPESTHHGECPICFLPLPLDESKSTINACCCKLICDGCDYANQLREFKERRPEPRCAFCRKVLPTTQEEGTRDYEKRAEANDPVAIGQIGWLKYKEGDYDTAFTYWTRAAALGNAQANYNLSIGYRMGHGVEKDEKLEMYHLEEAAIGGDPEARFDLGLHEVNNERYDRAVKHWIIAANLGHDKSLQKLKEWYKGGHVSKDNLTAALRAYQAAVDATKSPQREKAAKCLASPSSKTN